MNARLERILASIGTPAHVDQETPREVILALEVRRLRTQWIGLRAKVAESRNRARNRWFEYPSAEASNEEDMFRCVLAWMDSASTEAGDAPRAGVAKPAEPAASPEDVPGVAAHQAHGGLTLAEQAAAAAITLARRGGA